MSPVDQLLKWIADGADADDLLETSVAASRPALYRETLDAHDSWDAALATALVYVARREAGNIGRTASRGASVEDVERPERVVGDDAHVPVHVVTRSGHSIRMPLQAVPSRRDTELTEFPAGPGAEHAPDRLVVGVDDPGLVLITTVGNAVRIDARLLPEWERDAVTRPLHHRFGDIEPGEVVSTVIPARALRDADRFYSVSVFGQIKASDGSEYRRLSADATVALLLKDGDALFDVFAGAARTNVFVASSAGKSIVFPTADIRSQGRRATGVRAIGLDDGARVVGAFDTHDREWLVQATEQGLFKRTPIAEYRPQGRGGGGLQSCRLNAGDQVASVSPIDIAGDVLVLTNRGRVARFASYDVPFGNRAAKGESVLELGDDEVVTQVVGVPAGHYGVAV